MPLSPAELACLADSKPFAGVPPAVLKDVLAAAAVRELATGAPVIAPGERHRQLHVVLRGELGVFADEGAKLALSKIGPGDCAGEQSVLDHEPASALVVATAPTRLAVLTAEQAWTAMERAPAIALNLLRLLSARLRSQNASLRATFERQTMLESTGTTDSLTGLHTRRWMEEVFEREILRCHRAGKPSSLLLVDIDRLREVNETLGHRIGDAVLARFADLMQRTLRPRDLLARYGGEEFCVLLPEVGARRALQAAERLRARIDSQPAQISREIQVCYTISVGIAEWESGMDLSDLVDAASGALDAAKDSGCNRVELAGPWKARQAA